MPRPTARRPSPAPTAPAVGSWGPAIVGHANDEVNAALKAQIDKGTSFGAPCELEVRGAWQGGPSCPSASATRG